MSPTEAMRSGLTGTVTGVVAAPLAPRARTSTLPGCAAMRALTLKRPSSSERPAPTSRQSPPGALVSKKTSASPLAPCPRRAISPPGATALIDGVAERPPRPAIVASELNRSGTWKSAANPITPSAISAAIRFSDGCGRHSWTSARPTSCSSS